MAIAVYIAPEVAEVRALHPELHRPAFVTAPIVQQIDQQARTLHGAHRVKDPRVRMQICSWWPQAAGQSLETILTEPFTLADARLTLCREYGFADWQVVAGLGKSGTDPAFEHALDVMLRGDLAALTKCLDEEPQLCSKTSRYGHKATLLHYLGANGVESHRQVMPTNAPTLAKLLLSRGADPKAEAGMYGGGQTPIDLARTSAHPVKAGIAEALCAALEVS